MSAVLEAQEPSARYLEAEQPTLVRQFDLLATAPAGVRRLRALIQTLAVQGKLVAQHPGDEPATALLTRVRTHKARMVSAGDIRAAKLFAEVAEEEQPFSLPATWTWARFGDVTINRDGERIPVSSDDREQRAKVYDYYGASGVIDKIDGYLFDKTLLLIGEDGANLLNRSTPIAFLAHGKYWVNNHAHVIDTIEPGLMRYLELFINAISLEPYVTGTAQPKMNQAKLNNIVVALPPLAEQSRIVARVDELMCLCDALEAKGRLEAEQHGRLLGTLLGTLTDSSTPEELAANWQRVADHFDLLLDRPEAVDALEQTILQLAVRGLLVPQDAADVPAQKLSVEIQRLRRSKRKITPPDGDAIAEAGIGLPIGWSWCSVDQVSADDETAIADGPFGANLKTEHYVESEGFRVIRLQNIGAGVFRDEHRAYVDEDRYNRLLRHAAFPGDIVVAGLVDDSIRCCIVPDGIGPAIVKADCYRFAVHERVSAQYICLYLCSETAHQFASAHHHGLTLTRIGLGNFRSIPVPLPPADEQRRIVARVNELRHLCAELRQRLGRGRATQAGLASALIDQALAA